MFQSTLYSFVAPYSVEVIFLGMNCVLYGFCAYTLWGQKSLSCRMLFIINTVEFLLCVVQTIFHAILLFIVLIVIAGNALAYLAHVNGYVLACSIIYNINFTVGGLLSIWRLYVLYDNNLRVCLPAFIFWIGQVCASGIIIYICATVPLISAHFNVTNMLLWTFITVLYLYVAISICYRLCMAQKRTHTVLSHSLYKSVAIIAVECGGLITLCSVAMLILYACNFAYALHSLGIATEASVASQLLITARHAMLSQHHDASSPPPAAFEINVTPTESRHASVPMTPVKIDTHSSRFGAKSAGQEKLVAA